ncbi:MAG: CDP-glycerol glycerophosphotransferase family protein [Candidatus Gastranaerophilales bacterium]|nr:CDP-glycerol glycerophosphotransferase family protein [Candidatus Gastranaerophilales bacterium]
MYIPYDKIGKTIELFTPYGFKRQIRTFFEGFRVHQNCRYIESNSKKVLKRLQTEAKKRPLKVVFHVYDESKWKCQSLYDLMEQDKNFEPVIIATKNCAKKEYILSYMPPWYTQKVYNFFRNKNMRLEIGYDWQKDEFIPLEKFNPDIIIYQAPWYVHKNQGPVMCSAFALTYYVPYFVATALGENEYYLRFHRYIHAHYVLNQLIHNYYAQNMSNKGKNLRVAGHPQLDYFYLNKNKFEEKKYVIYAPHWSFLENKMLRWGTFKETGQFMLQYAKKHPEITWIFKPHPGLKGTLTKIMSKEEIADYYNEWAKIGMCYETGDYLDLFMQSSALITDCGSFLTEYFMTGQPVIHLASKYAKEYNSSVEKILGTYYRVWNNDELKESLDKILIDKEDPLKDKRLELLEELDFKNSYAAKNILDDIKKELGIL